MEAKRISELNHQAVDLTHWELQKGRRTKESEDNFGNLWNNLRTNIHVTGLPEGDRREEGAEELFEEIMPENFPNLGKEIITQVQETQWVPNRINPRQNTPRHILIKFTKIKCKEQILQAAGEKQQITHKGIPIRITADILIETLQATRNGRT